MLGSGVCIPQNSRGLGDLELEALSHLQDSYIQTSLVEPNEGNWLSPKAHRALGFLDVN